MSALRCVDIAIFAGSERAAKRIWASVVAWIEGKLKIEVNRDKSGTGLSQDTQLLGFRIHGKGEVSIAPKALTRMKQRVRAIWERRRHRTEDELKRGWRSYIEGGWNYFCYANWRAAVHRLSGWIRRHMRKYFWQRGIIREDEPTRYAALGCEDGVLGWLGAVAGRGRWRVTWWFNKRSRPRALTVLALDFHGNSRVSREAKLAGLNRRMRKTARTVVWED